jgi:anti-sigma-K factor RskA
MTPDRILACDEVRDLAPLYVIGALDPAEEDAIRAHLATCADPHSELAELGLPVAALLLGVEPVDPPPGLRTRLLAAAAADLVEGRHPASAAWVPAPASSVAAVAPAAPIPVLPSTPALDAPGRAVLTPARAPAIFPVPVAMVARRPSWVVRIAALAAVIAIVVLGGLGLSLQRQLDAERAYRDGVSAALALAARPGSQTALLAAGDGSVSGLGVVGADGTVRLAMRGLTATSGTQVYTAWAIGGSGTPVAIGDFTVGADGTAVAAAHVPAAEAGVVLALTLEPRGGDTTPRAPVVAKGVARPPAG